MIPMPEKLAIITGSDIRLFGGEERYIIELAKSLKDLDITIFSGKVAGISSDKKETIKNLGLNLVFYDSVKIPVTLETLPLSSSFLLSLKNFDYIYLTDPSLPTLSLVLLFSGKHPKIIFGMHNANSIRSKSIKGGLFWDLLVKVYSPIQRSVLFKVPNIHVLNNEDYSILKRLGYPHRIYPIKNFIFFRPEKVQENNKFIILFVGRLVPYQKGIDLLDQITKHILSLDKNIEFHIVGTGTSEGRQIVKGLVRRNSQIKWLKTL
jgi:glycosyltransferase involved in cell wall biosynthesis